MHFLEKMRPFIEWLQNAEEGKQFLKKIISAFSRANLIKLPDQVCVEKMQN